MIIIILHSFIYEHKGTKEGVEGLSQELPLRPGIVPHSLNVLTGNHHPVKLKSRKPASE